MFVNLISNDLNKEQTFFKIIELSGKNRLHKERGSQRTNTRVDQSEIHTLMCSGSKVITWGGHG